jgi:hypothetical protein
MNPATETRWSIGQVLLVVAMPLLILALSMDWYSGVGVGLGDVFRGADRELMARMVGAVGYLTCVPGFFVFLETSAGGIYRPRALLLAEWLAVLATLFTLAGGLYLATSAPYDAAMEPGFPLFCCATVCMLIGLLASWPPKVSDDRSGA